MINRKQIYLKKIKNLASLRTSKGINLKINLLMTKSGRIQLNLATTL